MNAPFVSVIIPVYNRREKLARALTSVWKQTFNDYECIIVDDGSTDEPITLPRFENRHIRYIQQPVRTGVSAARNVGVSNARGTWIAFLDSDDEWFPEKLNRQFEYIGRHPAYRILQTKELWIRRGVRVNPPKTHIKREGDLFSVSLERCMITPSSVILQKSLFEETGGFNESLPACEDYDLWLRITSRYPVGLVDEPLMVRYGGHNDQLSATVPVLDRFRIRSMLDLLEKQVLTPPQAKSCTRQLLKKVRIIANGYKKRGKRELYERYHAIEKRFGNHATRV